MLDSDTRIPPPPTPPIPDSLPPHEEIEYPVNESNPNAAIAPPPDIEEGPDPLSPPADIDPQPPSCRNVKRALCLAMMGIAFGFIIGLSAVPTCRLYSKGNLEARRTCQALLFTLSYIGIGIFVVGLCALVGAHMQYDDQVQDFSDAQVPRRDAFTLAYYSRNDGVTGARLLEPD